MHLNIQTFPCVSNICHLQEILDIKEDFHGTEKSSSQLDNYSAQNSVLIVS